MTEVEKKAEKIKSHDLIFETESESRNLIWYVVSVYVTKFWIMLHSSYEVVLNIPI